MFLSAVLILYITEKAVVIPTIMPSSWRHHTTKKQKFGILVYLKKDLVYLKKMDSTNTAFVDCFHGAAPF